DAYRPKLSEYHNQLVKHFQEQWECRRAVEDYSQRHKQAWKTFCETHKLKDGYSTDDELERVDKDLTFKMDQLVDTGEDEMTETEFDHVKEDKNAKLTILQADGVGLYKIPTFRIDCPVEGKMVNAGVAGMIDANMKKAFYRAQQNTRDMGSQGNTNTPADHDYDGKRGNPKQPRITSLEKEERIARLKILAANKGRHDVWEEMHSWRRTAIAISMKYSLNAKQR
ncbi:hypothetical protein CYLTODRAFT_466555, partial [Cylindrobasidium torrendii FP15055 ss-10]